MQKGHPRGLVGGPRRVLCTQWHATHVAILGPWSSRAKGSGSFKVKVFVWRRKAQPTVGVESSPTMPRDLRACEPWGADGVTLAGALQRPPVSVLGFLWSPRPPPCPAELTLWGTKTE